MTIFGLQGATLFNLFRKHTFCIRSRFVLVLSLLWISLSFSTALSETRLVWSPLLEFPTRTLLLSSLIDTSTIRFAGLVWQDSISRHKRSCLVDVVHLRYRKDTLLLRRLRPRLKSTTPTFRPHDIPANATQLHVQNPFDHPMSCSSYLQQAFDAHCHLCPSLIDILTIDLVPECPSTPISCLLHEHHSAFLFQDHEHSIVLDTGASISVSPFKDDFLSWDKHSSLPTLQSLTGTASVLGYGMVNWPVQTDQGLVHSIKTKAYFVPDAAVRLLSPQRYISTSTERSLSMLPSAIKFQLDRNSSVTLAYSGLPSVPLVSRVKRGNLFAGMTSNVISPQNTNLSPYQKEVLAWHYRLGHFHLPWIERLTRPRIASELPGIPLRNKRPVNTTMQHVKCRACQTAKASRRPEGVHVERAIPTKEMALQRDIIRVGAKVATDQFVSAVRGRRFHTFGKENEGQKFTGGTVFVDISSGFISACMQVSLKAQETILAKRRFERDLHLHGHKIVQYLGDNGVFRSEEFSLELQKKGQTIEFCGVGAHHQNGVAERSIRTISDSARSMLIHAAIHWPEAVDLSLWPMAVEYATYLYNRTPGRVSDTSPMEHVSGQRSNLEDIRSARVWGCPAFVLDPRKQDGKKLPRWVPRARRGQFLGRSRSHASSVGLIRNLNTGSISTQFHVVYDDFFTTVSSNEQNMALVETWPHLLKFSCEDLLFDDDTRELAPPLENEWLTTEEARLRTIKLIPRRVNPPIPVPEGGINEAPTPNREEPGNDVPLDLAQHGTQVDSDESDDESIPEVEHRRNPRRQLRGFNRRYHGSEFVNFIHDEQQDYAQESSNINFLNNIIYNFASTISNNQQVLRMEQDMSYSVDQFNFVHDWHPAYLATKASSEDNPTLRQAMNSPERHGWIESMERELTSLEDMDVYEEVNRYEAKGNPILDSTWAFKRKRYPDGSIRKLKGRLCVRGDQQIEGIDFFETYAPVVQWATVRMLLIISFTHKLTTKQVDYFWRNFHLLFNDALLRL